MNESSVSGNIPAPRIWQWEKDEPVAPAVKAGNTIYVAGHVALDPDGNLVGDGDMPAQADQCFRNIENVLSRFGARMSDIVKLTTYFSGHLDKETAQRYWQVREKYFGPNGPASTGLLVSGLISPEFLIEIEAIAVLTDDA